MINSNITSIIIECITNLYAYIYIRVSLCMLWLYIILWIWYNGVYCTVYTQVKPIYKYEMITSQNHDTLSLYVLHSAKEDFDMRQQCAHVAFARAHKERYMEALCKHWNNTNISYIRTHTDFIYLYYYIWR